MRYTTLPGIGFTPEFTPKTIKNLILYTVLITITASLGSIVCDLLFGISGPETWFSLSWKGISNYFLWQPATYLFVYYTAGQGITIPYLLDLLFQMFLLWVAGTQVFDRIGRQPFLKLYLFSGILTGLATILLTHLIGYHPILSGPSASLLAIALIWTFMYPETELWLLFLIPIKAKWLTAGILGAILLISISSGNVPSLLFYVIGSVISYFYGLFAWGLRMPFRGFEKFESYLISKVKAQSKKPKIFDISTGAPPLDDDRFIDAMLEKISKKGENSLTWHERKRMEEISEKKRQKKSRKN